MTKSQLAGLVTEKSSLSKKEAEEVINTILKALLKPLKMG